MVNTPIPHSLKSEAKKAAKILRQFSVPSAKVGPDKLIPAGILLKAKGLAILTVVRAGFLVTARGGSGIVIAKPPEDADYDGEWSSPSAIGIAGLGGGFEVGAEVTDFVIILNSRTAVEAFSKGGNLTLGGNFSIAAGPLGRNLEADIAVRSPAAIYTYSKTKGLFAGISVEGSGLIERKDANKKFYGRDIRAYEILSGQVKPPEDCEALYEVLEMHKRRAEQQALDMAKKYAHKQVKERSPVFSFRGKEEKSMSRSENRSQPSHRIPTHTESLKMSKTVVRHTVVTTRTTHSGSKHSLQEEDMWNKQMSPLKAVAKFSYEAQLPCDLSFKKGDEIVVLTRTPSENDWWEGTIKGKTGIFPANYITVKS